MHAFFEGLCGRGTYPFHGEDAELRRQGSLFAGAQVIRLVQLIVKTVEHKVQKIRNYGFRPFRFQKFH